MAVENGEATSLANRMKIVYRLIDSFIAFFIGKTSAHSVRTKCRNPARHPIEGNRF